MSLKKVMSYTQMTEFLGENSVTAKDFYHKKNFTAKELAEHFSIIYNKNWQKACFRVLGQKGLGLGGERKGSGNRKEGRQKRIIRKKEGHETISISIHKNSLAAMQKMLKSGESYSTFIQNLILEKFENFEENSE